MVAHACNPSTWEAETRGSQVRDQSLQCSVTLSNLVRPCFKTKNSWVWWHTLVILVLGRMRQEDHRFKASLSNLVRLQQLSKTLSANKK